MSKKRFFALVMTLAMLLTLFAPAFTFAAKNRDETPKPKTVYVGIVEHLDPDANWQNYTVHYWGDEIEAGDAELHNATGSKREWKNVGSWSDSQRFYIYTANIPAEATGYKVHNGETWFGGDGAVTKLHAYVFEYGGNYNAKYYQSSGMKVHGSGQEYYESLEDALAHAKTDGSVSNMSLLVNQNAGSLYIDANKYANIMLSEYTLTANFQVAGTLKLSGSDGTFNGTITLLDGGECIITGGTYNFDPTEFVPSGYDVVTNLNGTYTVQRHVEPYIYIKVAAGEGGSASADPTKIARADVGTAYSTLTATPEEGYVFDKWVIDWGGMVKPQFVGDDTVEDAVCRIVPTADQTTATATFKAAPVVVEYSITYVNDPVAGGTITGPKSATAGDKVKGIDVTVNTGYELDSVVITAADGTVIPHGGSEAAEKFEFTMPAQNVTVTAKYSGNVIPLGYDAQIKVVKGKAEVAIAYKGQPFKQDNLKEVPAGSELHAAIIPAAGYTVTSVKANGKDVMKDLVEAEVNEKQGWRLPIEMPAEALIIEVELEKAAADFKLNVTVTPSQAATYTVLSIVNGEVISGQQDSYKAGDKVEIGFTPAEGWTPVSVTVNGKPVDPLNGTTYKWQLEFVDKDLNVVATFTNPNAEYTITYVDDPTAGGKITGPASATAGTQVKGIDVTVNEGYKLLSVEIKAADGTTIEHSGAQTEEKFEFTMPRQNVTVTAKYISTLVQGYTATIKVTNGKGYVATTGTDNKQSTIYNVPKDAQVTAGFEGTDNTWLLKSARLNGTEIDRTKITVKEHVGAEDRTCYEYEFKMPEGNVTIDVEFAKEVVDHKLTLVTKGNAGTATLNPAAGNVAAGTPVKLTITPKDAVPDGEFHPTVSFDPKIKAQASKDLNNRNVYYDFVMPDEDLTVTVDFGTIEEEGLKLNVTVTPEEAATYSVISIVDGEVISGQLDSYKTGDKVEVSFAPADEDWICASITVNGETVDPSSGVTEKWQLEFEDEDLNIVATFTKLIPQEGHSVTVDVTNEAYGKASADKTKDVKPGETVTVTAKPAEGYKAVFVRTTPEAVMEHEATVVNGNTMTFIMPLVDVRVTVTFIPDGEGEYTVTIDKDLGSCPAIRLEDGSYHSEYNFNEGNQVTIQTTPDKSHVLVHLWANGKEVQVDANGDYIFNMPAEDVLITAEYGLYFNKLIIEEADNGTVTSDQQNPESVAVNTQVTLTIKPNKGYELDTLIVDGVDVTNQVEKNAYTFTMPAHDVTVTATFKESIALLYTVKVEYINGEHGSAYLTFTNGGNHYEFPQTVAPNKTVFVGVECEYGFREIVTIAADDGTEIERIENMKYGFIMPAADVTVTVKFVPMPHFWASHGLLLNTEIGVIFYVDFGDFTPDDFPGTYATFTVAGTDGEQKCFVDKTDYIQTNDGRKHYKTYCYVNSISMADKITPVLHLSYEGVDYDSEGQLYAVADYVAANYNSDKLTTKQKNLLKALADYGHYAQLYLGPLNTSEYGEHAEMPAYNYQSTYNYETVWEAVKDLKIVRPDEPVGNIEAVTFSLYTDSRTRLYLYAKMVDGATTKPTYQYGEESGDMQYVAKKGKYLYKGPSFMPTDLGTMVDVTLGDGAGESTRISFSVMSWVERYVKENDTARQNFCAALYYYYVTARALVS